VSALELEALRLSLSVAFWATVAALPFAVAAAYALARFEFPGKTILDGLIHLPLVLPPVVVGYLLLLLFGRTGVFGAPLEEIFGIRIAFTWSAAAIAAGIMGFPLMVRAIRLSLEAVDRGLEQAAATLGAPPARVFLRVTLPLMLPGLIAGTFLGFARALGEFGATITFAANIPGETRTLPLALYSLLQSPGGETAALRLMLLSIILAVGALAVSEIAARRIRRRMESAV